MQTIIILTLLATAIFIVASGTRKGNFEDGDIIFNTSPSRQSKYIQLATLSRYSHCGIIFHIDGKPFVYEAVQPVKYTALDRWIEHGKGSHYVVKRLKKRCKDLSDEDIDKMMDTGMKYKGKNYDRKFEWDDDKIYCSELIWKIYKEALDIELCKTKKVKEFIFSKVPVVRKEMKRRGINLNEDVVAPSDILHSSKLTTIMKQ